MDHHYDSFGMADSPTEYWWWIDDTQKQGKVFRKRLFVVCVCLG